MRQIGNVLTTCLALGVALVGEALAGGSLVPATIAPDLSDTVTGAPAPGMFLVARRKLDGSHFGRTVVFLVEHDGSGTLGLIVNRPSGVGLSEALPEIEEELAAAHALYYGGPVELSTILMLVRSESAAAGLAHVVEDLYVGADRRVLDRMLAAKKPAAELRFYVGYSGWAAGQLDFELLRGDWHVVRADTAAIFSGESTELWHRLIERLEPAGIQVDRRESVPDPVAAVATAEARL